jgi:hypothetical protein
MHTTEKRHRVRATKSATADTATSSPRRWLTPKCPSGGGQSERMTEGGGLRKLEDQITLWQTPSVADTMGGHLTRGGDRSGEPLLKGQAALFATPAARDWKSGGASVETMNRNARPLNEQVVNSPTFRPDPESLTDGEPSPDGSGRRLQTPKLNPFFDAWLMNWPPTWPFPVMMRFGAAEMESYLSRQRSRLRSLLCARGLLTGAERGL